MRRWTVALALVGPLLLAGTARAQLTATVDVLQGRVSVSPLGSAERDAVLGEQLPMGTILRTGSDGLAELTFGDGLELKVRANTRLRLSGKRRSKPKRSVVLFFGRLWGKLTGGGEPYEVRTSTAIAGVRGTILEVGAGTDAATRIRCTDGEVEVSSDDADVFLGAGQQVDSDWGGMGKPTEIAGDPDDWSSWEGGAREHTRLEGGRIADAMSENARERQSKLEELKQQQDAKLAERNQRLQEADVDDPNVAADLDRMNAEIAEINDQIVDLAETMGAAFELSSELSRMAEDPTFDMQGSDIVRDRHKVMEDIQDAVNALLSSSERAVPADVGPPSGTEEGDPSDTSVGQGRAMAQRVSSAVDRIRNLQSGAKQAGDAVKEKCIKAHYDAAQGLVGIADQSLSDLKSAVAARDSYGADNALTKLSVVSQKADNRYSQASACAGAIDVYSGETEVEVEIDEDALPPDEPPQPLSTPVVVRPPAASPFQ